MGGAAVNDQATKLRSLVSDKGAASVACSRGKSISGCSVGKSVHVPNVIAVTSGKGGVGKTTCAVNLALIIAESGNDVLLVDADLGLANVDIMLGLDSSRHIGHLLLPEYTAEDVAAVGPLGIRVISGGSGLRELAEADESERRLLLEKLRSYYDKFHYVIIDTSPGIGADVVDFLKEASRILVITTTEPASLRDTYAAMKTIARHVPEADVRPIINMTGSDTHAEAAMSALNEVADQFIGQHYKRWHRIGLDPLISRAANDRKPFIRSYPRSPAAVSLRTIANTITDNQSEAAF